MVYVNFCSPPIRCHREHVLSVQAQNCLDHRGFPGKWGLPLNSPLLIINWKSNVPLLAIRKPKNLISRGNRSHRLWRKLLWARFVDKSLCSTSEKREALYFMSFDMSLMDFERPCMSQLEAWARQYVTEGCSAAHVCCMKRDPLSLGSGTSFHHGYI